MHAGARLVRSVTAFADRAWDSGWHHPAALRCWPAHVAPDQHHLMQPSAWACSPVLSMGDADGMFVFIAAFVVGVLVLGDPSRLRDGGVATDVSRVSGSPP